MIIDKMTVYKAYRFVLFPSYCFCIAPVKGARFVIELGYWNDYKQSANPMHFLFVIISVRLRLIE